MIRLKVEYAGLLLWAVAGILWWTLRHRALSPSWAVYALVGCIAVGFMLLAFNERPYD